MICPLCGSERVVWVYDRGDIVCSDCGHVIDVIFESGCREFQSDIDGTSVSVLRYRGYIHKRERSYSVYSELSRKLRGRPDIFLDPIAFQKALSSNTGGRPVMMFKSVRNYKAMEMLRRDPSLNEIIANIISKSPVLASRTVRGKAAAAYAIKALLSGMTADPRKISRDTGVSLTQAKRILKLVKRTIISHDLTTKR